MNSAHEKLPAYEQWRVLEQEAKDIDCWRAPRKRRATVAEKNLSEKHLSDKSFKRNSSRNRISPASNKPNTLRIGKKSVINHRREGRRTSRRAHQIQKLPQAKAPAEDLHQINDEEHQSNSAQKSLDINSNKTKTGPIKMRKFKKVPIASMLKGTPGELIFGNLKGFDWWPARIISHVEAKQRRPTDGHSWVRWFGDYKISEILLSSMVSFSEFPTKFRPTRMRGIYKRGIEEALEMFACHCNKLDLPSVDNNKDSKDARLKAAIDWITNGLSEKERNALEGHSGSQETTSEVVENGDDDSELDSDDDNAYTKSATSVKRFEATIHAPTLAEDVKRLFDQVEDGQRSIETICLGCGDTKVHCQHPLFQGGLCKECKAAFVESAYLFDEDGSQMYCTICSDGREVLMCDSPGCCRSYCGVCIDMLCGVGHTEKIADQEKWICFMCSGKMVRLLKRRDDWQTKLSETMGNDIVTDYPPFPAVAPIPLQERKPIRVLALFDGIATGLQALRELDIDVQTYYASEIDEQATTVASVQHGATICHLGDVELITEKQISELGPFDLVVGGSPCNDLSIANPARKGLFDGSGRLFFEFFRLLMFARPDPSTSDRPFFWLFENVVGMRQEDKRAISRFLQCNPVMCDAKEISAQHRARYFWGNLPGMKRSAFPLPSDKLNLQQCLEKNCGRVAKFQKVRTVTTKSNSLKQTKASLLPVEMRHNGKSNGDYLWCTEIERLFGFPDHYTDVGNMGKTQRQRLLGSAWSVPVVRHLLAPLREYFKCGSCPS